uniref:Uncharacterized protein n=1 Tax=Meloidogyne incognita TaxID=6306 RepID=A0A914KJN6_MELIC
MTLPRGELGINQHEPTKMVTLTLVSLHLQIAYLISEDFRASVQSHSSQQKRVTFSVHLAPQNGHKSFELSHRVVNVTLLLNVRCGYER